MSAHVREMTFGERYEDGSGWAWRVALTVGSGGHDWLEIGGREADFIRSDPEPAMLRQMAGALVAIAEALERRP